MRAEYEDEVRRAKTMMFWSPILQQPLIWWAYYFGKGYGLEGFTLLALLGSALFYAGLMMAAIGKLVLEHEDPFVTCVAIDIALGGVVAVMIGIVVWLV
ncbi:MAG: hypothetical protein V7752_07045 [Halopseudomonas sp.]